MDFFARLAEDRIVQAQVEGRFDNLAGSGQPLDLETESGVREDLRLAYKILKNAHCLPPEVELRRELVTLGALIRSTQDEGERARLVREANFKILKLNTARRVPVSREIEEYFFRRTTEGR